MYDRLTDVSRYQGVIDFVKMKSVGVKMCYIKATEGINYKDPNFVTNMTKAKAAGMPWAPYHYYRPQYDPIAQAKWFCDNAPVGDDAHIGDIEETTYIPSGYAAKVLSFLTEVERRTGTRPIIYSRSSYWKLYLQSGSMSWASFYRYWVAHYTELSGPNMCLPWDPMQWYAWQFGTPGVGLQYGVQTLDIDMSVFNVSGPHPALLRPTLPELEYLAAIPSPVAPQKPTLLDYWHEWKATRGPNYRRG